MFFLWFPLCRGEADLLVTAKYGYFRKFGPCCMLAFSLHFSSSSAFLRSLFIQSSHLSCDRPRFLEPSSSLSRLFSVVYHLSFGPPPRYKKVFTWLMSFSSNLMFRSSLCFPTHITSVVSRFIFRPCFLNMSFHSSSAPCNNYSSRCSATITRSSAYIIFLRASVVQCLF